MIPAWPVRRTPPRERGRPARKWAAGPHWFNAGETPVLPGRRPWRPAPGPAAVVAPDVFVAVGAVKREDDRSARHRIVGDRLYSIRLPSGNFRASEVPGIRAFARAVSVPKAHRLELRRIAVRQSLPAHRPRARRAGPQSGQARVRQPSGFRDPGNPGVRTCRKRPESASARTRRVPGFGRHCRVAGPGPDTRAPAALLRACGYRSARAWHGPVVARIPRARSAPMLAATRAADSMTESRARWA